MDTSCPSYLSVGVPATRFAPVYVYAWWTTGGVDLVSVVPFDRGTWPDSFAAGPRVRVQGRHLDGAWIDSISGADFHARGGPSAVRDPFARNLSGLGGFFCVVERVASRMGRRSLGRADEGAPDPGTPNRFHWETGGTSRVQMAPWTSQPWGKPARPAYEARGLGASGGREERMIWVRRRPRALIFSKKIARIAVAERAACLSTIGYILMGSTGQIQAKFNRIDRF